MTFVKPPAHRPVVRNPGLGVREPGGKRLLGVPSSVTEELEAFRPPLTRYCYSMLGSIFDAEDAVQDTVLRAWQHWGEVDNPAARRSWMFRIATNVCLDKLRQLKRRALPMDLTAPVLQVTEPRDTRPAESWVWPAPDYLIGYKPEDPAETLARKDTLRLAFVAALQNLPPKQRAAFIMREAFGWSATDIAGLLDITVASATSALQRARATIARADLQVEPPELDARSRDVLDRFWQAFERYDVAALAALFHEDGSLSMPPFVMWVKGRPLVRAFYELTRPHCEGSRLLPVSVNATGGFAQYAPAADGGLRPWGLHVPEIRAGRIAHVYTFIHKDLYTLLGLPDSLPTP